VVGTALRVKVETVTRKRKHTGLALAEKGFEINPSLNQVTILKVTHAVLPNHTPPPHSCIDALATKQKLTAI